LIYSSANMQMISIISIRIKTNYIKLIFIDLFLFADINYDIAAIIGKNYCFL